MGYKKNQYDKKKKSKSSKTTKKYTKRNKVENNG